MHSHYRGFDIILARDTAWSATIRSAATGRSLSHRPTSTLEEGDEPCLARARRLVDAYRALRG